MTIQVDATDVATAVEVAAWVASLVAMLVMGLIVYLMVRPSRRGSRRRQDDDEALQLEEMVRLMERMEQRLEVLERAISAAPDEERVLARGAEGVEYGRTK